MPVPWAGELFRGVSLRGWRGAFPFRLAARFSAVCGAGRFGWFFHMELLGGLFVGTGACLWRMVRERPGGFRIPSGRSSRFGLFYIRVSVVLFPLAAGDGVGGDGCGGE